VTAAVVALLLWRFAVFRMRAAYAFIGALGVALAAIDPRGPAAAQPVDFACCTRV
jgi:hypothetical protein